MALHERESYMDASHAELQACNNFIYMLQDELVHKQAERSRINTALQCTNMAWPKQCKYELALDHTDWILKVLMEHLTVTLKKSSELTSVFHSANWW